MANPFHKPARITQGFGKTNFTSEPAWGAYRHFHRGIDAVPADGEGTGAKLYAVRSGTIFSAGTDTDGANYIIVRYDDGRYGSYWHLAKKPTVKAGQKVTADTQIGEMGSTGNSTGPHLHYEECEAGPWQGLLKMTPVDPTSQFSNTTTPATGPGKDDVTWNDFVRTMYRLFRPGDALTDAIVNNHAANLARLDSKGVDNWIRNFIASGDQYVTPHKVLATYWTAKGGADPDRYADERLVGGETIASVLNGDLPADAKALKEAQEQKEATDAALTGANDYGRELNAKIIAQEDEIRELHIKLESTEQGESMPEFALEPNKLDNLGNYFKRLAKLMRKGGGNS